MGIYDREYYRSEPQGFSLRGDRTMVTNLILINVGIYLIDVFANGELSGRFSLFSDLASHPWRAYELVTYGFLHNPDNLLHVAFNMLGLWFFGRDVELKYGRREFLFLYLSLVALSGFAWMVIYNVSLRMGDPQPWNNTGKLLGASGAVTGVLLLFALNYPRRTVLLYFVVPIPAWVFAILLVLMDAWGAMNRGDGDKVAYTCHLAGAFFALAYFRTGWSLGRLVPAGLSLKGLKSRPKLRLHDPDERDQDISRQVDEILRKIQEQGQDSLSRKERRILEEASRRYQQKHR